MRRILNGCRAPVMEYLHAVNTAWNSFWFTPQDPTTLGVIRVLTGLMLVYTHSVWGLRLHDFFGPNGWIGPALHDVQAGQFVFSYLWYVPPGLLGVVHWSALIVLILFTIGLFTRVTSILSFFILINYAHRVPMALFGLDQINALLTLYCAVGPSGATLSVDRLIARYRTAKRLLEEHREARIALEPSVEANIAIRLIQLHMCVLYFFAALSKHLGEAWWNGEAIWLAAANYEYQSGDLTWLAHVPVVAHVLTHVTALWELSYCVLIWPRLTRPIVLLGAVMLHMGIALFMGMITFGLIMLVANIAFVSPQLLRRLLTHTVRSPSSLTVLYDGACGLCIRSAAWLKAFDAGSVLRLIDFNRIDPTAFHPSLTVDKCLGAMQVVERRDNEPQVYPGFWGIRRIVQSVRLLWPAWPLLSVPGMATIGQRVYAVVAANRARRIGCTSGCALHVPEVFSSRARAPLHLRVKLPADATLFVQDQIVPGNGEERRFTSRPARFGKEYMFELRVEINRDGLALTMSQRVRLRAGEHVVAEFRLDPNSSQNRPSEQQAAIISAHTPQLEESTPEFNPQDQLDDAEASIHTANDSNGNGSPHNGTAPKPAHDPHETEIGDPQKTAEIELGGAKPEAESRHRATVSIGD